MYLQTRSQGLVLSVQPRARQLFFQIGEPDPRLRQSQPVFVVHAEMSAFIEQAMLRDDASSEKSRGLANDTGVPHSRDLPRLGRISLESVIGQVDVIGHAVNDVDIRMAFEECNDARDRIRIVYIVRVQPADNLAIGGTDSLVDCVGLAVVAFRDPSYAVAEPTEHSGSVVRAAAIEYDMFNVSAGLDGNALKGAPDELSLVEGWCYDADLHGELLSANSVSC